jgi:hypothetical protein
VLSMARHVRFDLLESAGEQVGEPCFTPMSPIRLRGRHSFGYHEGKTPRFRRTCINVFVVKWRRYSSFGGWPVERGRQRHRKYFTTTAVFPGHCDIGYPMPCGRISDPSEKMRRMSGKLQECPQMEVKAEVFDFSSKTPDLNACILGGWAIWRSCEQVLQGAVPHGTRTGKRSTG